MKSLLYVGNMLKAQGSSVSVMETHGAMLERHFKVYYASGKQNRLLRMLDMVFAFLTKQHKSDCVIISVYSTLNFYYAWAIALLCRVFRKPYVAYLHGGNLPARLARSPRMSRAIFSYALANVAPSGYLKNAFEQAGFKTTLIPNFIQIEKYPFFRRINLRPRLFWVRAFEKTYHPEMAVKVFAELKKTFPNATLCMVGSNKDGSMGQCKALSVELGIKQSMTFTGALPKSHWVDLSRDNHIFISTTRFDNTPVSIIEAMALGLAIVSTDVGGVPYLVEHKKTGLLSPDGDIPAMVANIITLLYSPALAASISRNARQKAETFDWKVVEKQWLGLLSHVP